MKTYQPLLVITGVLLLVGFLPPKYNQNKRPQDSRPQEPVKLSIFDIPQFEAQRGAFFRQIYSLLDRKEYDKAEDILRKWATNFPRDYAAPYDLACVNSLRGQTEQAFVFLKKAVEMGFRDTEHITKDEDLTSLRKDSRFNQILDISRQPFEAKPIIEVPKAQPAKATDGIVEVSAANFGYDGRTQIFLGLVEPNDTAIDPITKLKGTTGELLSKWYEEGSAAGHIGDFYDNHDGDHSPLDLRKFPQLTAIKYDAEMKRRNLHNGLQSQLIYNAIVLGNSSTALTQGPLWRSQPRHALTLPGGAARLAVQYRSNHIYFYPEHRDHDPGHNGKDGFGDVFPANTPYFVISQGSSGSDRPFMEAFAATLAAFRPETKARLRKNGLITPTLQMLFRRTSKLVENESDYFKGKAHPTVFKSENIDLTKMVKRAHALRAENIPPLAHISVTEEMEEFPGRDYFDIGPRQKFITTPHAIARIHKTTALEYNITLDASTSADLDERKLTYKWTILRGDNKRIKIEPTDKSGSKVQISVPWHERTPVQKGSKLYSNRVDIGLFVSNGTHWSTPAIFSIYHPDNQTRKYSADGRILSVKYDPSIYTDPRIDAPANWTDTYKYNDDMKLLGWTRTRKDSEPQSFTVEGRLILATNEKGEPTRSTAVAYVPKRQSNGIFHLEQVNVEDSQKKVTD